MNLAYSASILTCVKQVDLHQRKSDIMTPNIIKCSFYLLIIRTYIIFVKQSEKTYTHFA